MNKRISDMDNEEFVSFLKQVTNDYNSKVKPQKLPLCINPSEITKYLEEGNCIKIISTVLSWNCVRSLPDKKTLKKALLYLLTNETNHNKKIYKENIINQALNICIKFTSYD
jgi:hypothetical protein